MICTLNLTKSFKISFESKKLISIKKFDLNQINLIFFFIFFLNHDFFQTLLLILFNRFDY